MLLEVAANEENQPRVNNMPTVRCSPEAFCLSCPCPSLLHLSMPSITTVSAKSFKVTWYKHGIPIYHFLNGSKLQEIIKYYGITYVLSNLESTGDQNRCLRKYCLGASDFQWDSLHIGKCNKHIFYLHAKLGVSTLLKPLVPLFIWMPGVYKISKFINSVFL